MFHTHRVFWGNAGKRGFCQIPRGGEAVADQEREPVGRQGMDLRGAPPAEEFNIGGSSVVGEGLGVVRGMTQLASGQILRCPCGQEFAEFSFAELTYDLSGSPETAGFESVNANCIPDGFQGLGEQPFKKR